MRSVCVVLVSVLVDGLRELRSRTEAREALRTAVRNSATAADEKECLEISAAWICRTRFLLCCGYH